jgi:HD superfamily phosphohydrolase
VGLGFGSTFYSAGELCQALRKTGKGEINKQDQLCVEIAGLCHDLGKYRILSS